MVLVLFQPINDQPVSIRDLRSPEQFLYFSLPAKLIFRDKCIRRDAPCQKALFLSQGSRSYGWLVAVKKVHVPENRMVLSRQYPIVLWYTGAGTQSVTQRKLLSPLVPWKIS